MNVQELQCFMKVFETKSMNQTASQQFMTAQGVGRIINRLENELDTQLFVRSSKGVEPTATAKILYSYSERLIDHFTLLHTAIQNEKEKQKHLKMYLARGVLKALSFDFLHDFQCAYPEVDFSWKEMANQVVSQKIRQLEGEVGIVIGEVADKDITSLFIERKEVKLLVYHGHPFYQRDSIDLAELRHEKLIILNENYQVYHEFTRTCEKNNIDIELTAKTEDTSLLVNLSRMKVGLGVVLDFSLEGFEMKDLKVISLKEPLYWDIYAIFNRNQTNSPNVQRFKSYVNSRNKLV